MQLIYYNLEHNFVSLAMNILLFLFCNGRNQDSVKLGDLYEVTPVADLGLNPGFLGQVQHLSFASLCTIQQSSHPKPLLHDQLNQKLPFVSAKIRRCSSVVLSLTFLSTQLGPFPVNLTLLTSSLFLRANFSNSLHQGRNSQNSNSIDLH